MTRIDPVEPGQANETQKAALDAVAAELGGVPNLCATLAHSPAALRGYLAQVEALREGILAAPLREQIAIAVASANGCNYCASAHAALGRDAGLSQEEIDDNLAGRSADPRTAAVVDFAQQVVRERGRVSDAALQRVRDAGFCEEALVEILAHVGLNVFTNTFNHVAGTSVDFPLVDTAAVRPAAA